MVKPVSMGNMPKSSAVQGKNNKEAPQKNSFVRQYADSFVKHSIDSAPVLSGLTLVWSFLDKSRGVPLKKALSHNIKNFFLPVMLVTSSVTAYIENKKMNQTEN